ncbi:Ppx/GppA family phosphatase [Qipengyuania sediminis]|uniref:Ppx/GppA phosphatase family protein n=1 Tax=Qipengyuania sediminis TaxID=1532023 RepID=UPI0014051BC2|nr:Ppx/GppA family phosphatase [Qipengyuania sediminis]
MSRPEHDSRRAIIDVGSNSIRLVIYDGPARIPFETHNEKVQARLGRGLAETGAIDAQAYDTALAACRRFKALLDASGVAGVRIVATAAARDAANGPAFLADLAAIGLGAELLSGPAEGRASAAGVLSAFPGASGVVGDLGGGSLELACVGGGEIGRSESLSLGVLRLPALRRAGEAGFAAAVRKALAGAGWPRTGATGHDLYLVGGSWRALGHLDMHLTASALPGVHGYAFAPSRIAELRRRVAELGPRALKEVPGLTSSRIAALDDAAALLAVVAATLGSERLVVSGFGLREGLLFEALSAAERVQDPLLAATADYAARQGDRRWDGDAVDAWIAPLFVDAAPEARIRRAACRLAGVDLHPLRETRARHGLELAWLGAWIGVSAAERASLAATLWSAWGGRGEPAELRGFLTAARLSQSTAWGQAIRLAERLSGGDSAVLAHARLARQGEALLLKLAPGFDDLANGVAAKQLGVLAQQLGLAGALRPPA